MVRHARAAIWRRFLQRSRGSPNGPPFYVLDRHGFSGPALPKPGQPHSRLGRDFINESRCSASTRRHGRFSLEACSMIVLIRSAIPPTPCETTSVLPPRKFLCAGRRGTLTGPRCGKSSRAVSGRTELQKGGVYIKTPMRGVFAGPSAWVGREESHLPCAGGR